MTPTQLSSDIEVVNPNHPRGPIRHVVFDFDGTISLIREGWQQIMIPMMVEILLDQKSGESEEEIETLVRTFVTDLTGKQTIYQMIRLAEEIEKRGGKPLEPLEYKYEYLNRLGERIKDRRADLESGRAQPVDWVVPGSFDLLDALQTREVKIYLASGTDEKFVFEEAEMLKVTRYFDGIYGAQDDYKKFSKKMVIERILRENEVPGESLLTFGDGYVEIENTHEVGGLAVGVATNEAERKGIDAWKRERLIKAHADVIIPDFRETEILIPYLFGDNHSE
jgi:phosphoglycolate phosphatase-like HAD superfamily hydrolase